jgi:hypothetical protein
MNARPFTMPILVLIAALGLAILLGGYTCCTRGEEPVEASWSQSLNIQRTASCGSPCATRQAARTS